MSAVLRLPAWVDEADEAVDSAWDMLRGTPTIDRVFYAASAAGDFSAIWHALNVAQVVARPERRRAAIYTAAAIGAESLLVNQGIKRLFRRERPTATTGDRPHHLRQPSTSSFPSGHATAAMVASTLLSATGGRAPLYRGLATVVATSRVHVRIHHASDVVAGAAVGWALARTARRFLPSS